MDREFLRFPKRKPQADTQEQVHCFTDGSKSGDKCGAAYIIWDRAKRAQDFFPLGKLATVYQAELLAISEAARKMKLLNIQNKEINFFIDNQSAIKALGGYQCKNKITQECKDRLNFLGMNNKITLNWIPGHEGHMGNEVADRLAKMGAGMPSEGPTPLIPVANNTNTNLIKEWGNTLHQKNWEHRADCRQTKLFIKQIGTKLGREITSYNRSNIRILTQIITGHANLQRHRSIMGIEDDPTCPKCGDTEETSYHYLMECPYYNKIRHSIFMFQILDKRDLPYINLSDILSFVRRTKRWTESE